MDRFQPNSAISSTAMATVSCRDGNRRPHVAISLVPPSTRAVALRQLAATVARQVRGAGQDIQASPSSASWLPWRILQPATAAGVRRCR